MKITIYFIHRTVLGEKVSIKKKRNVSYGIFQVFLLLLQSSGAERYRTRAPSFEQSDEEMKMIESCFKMIIKCLALLFITLTSFLELLWVRSKLHVLLLEEKNETPIILIHKL